MIIGTSFVSPDEKAYLLFEANRRTPDSKAIHRYQVIRVLRDNKLADFTTDLGDSRKFKAALFNIPSFWEHTVGELRDMAVMLRNRRFDYSELPVLDLRKAYQEHLEKEKRILEV